MKTYRRITLGFFALSIMTTIHASNEEQQGSVWMTAKDSSHRLTQVEDLVFEDYRQPSEAEQFVFIDGKHTFQEMVGFGAAITDASAEVYARLPESVREEFIQAYFNPNTGIGYSLLRTTIHSSDFGEYSYTYVEENDKELQTFSIEHDQKFRIPLIKLAREVAGFEIPLYVSPWSPPAWMKDTGSMLQGGKLLPEFHQTWADYIAKFIKSYEKTGVPVWGLTVQNEPMAVQTWESCVYTAEEERDFVKNFLGPTLHRENLEDKKLIVWDHNRDLIFQRASTILNDYDAAKYVWGVGFHWYEPWTGSEMNFNNLRLVSECFPEKKLVFTEGCAESFDIERIDSWDLGEHYGMSMINDINCGTVAWTDWNILLDETGGPNHVQNLCFAPVHAIDDALVYTNSFYYIGHFSKFVKPGAKRIAASASRTFLLTTAFVNPDDSVVTIVMNQGEEEQKYFLIQDGKMAKMIAPPHSIATIVVQ